MQNSAAFDLAKFNWSMSGGEAGDADQGRPVAVHHLQEEGEGQLDDHHDRHQDQHHEHG